MCWVSVIQESLEEILSDTAHISGCPAYLLEDGPAPHNLNLLGDVPASPCAHLSGQCPPAGRQSRHAGLFPPRLPKAILSPVLSF